jgi:glucosamine--fructose-6-phosphate aminotransferase (isomerizing)
MCGIAAAVSPAANIVPLLLEGLRKLEYRGGELYVLTDADSHFPETEQIHVLRLPEHHGDLTPILHVLPLQLLAYHTAQEKGTDVDNPRNLAKSVTVE